MVPKTIDFGVLAQLGLEKEVGEKFRAIGWEKFLDWDTTTYSSLVREFYKEMKVEMGTDGKPTSIVFTLFRSKRKMTMEDLDIFLNMISFADKFEDKYVDAIKAVPVLKKGEWNGVWKSLAKTAIKGSESRETTLKTNVLRMCHRILAIKFYEKKDISNNVSQVELYILWEM